MTRGAWVCICGRVPESALTAYLDAHPRASFEQFTKRTGAGVTCGSCSPTLVRLHRAHRRKRAAEASGQLDLLDD